MGRRTVLWDQNMTLTAGVTVLAAFRPAATLGASSIVRVTRVEISQHATTTLQMVRGVIANRVSGSTLTMQGMSPTPIALGGAASGLASSTAPAAAAGRAGTNASLDTTPSYGYVRPFVFANLNGYLWKPDPKEEIVVVPDQVFVVKFLADPTSLAGWTIAVDLDEGPD